MATGSTSSWRLAADWTRNWSRSRCRANPSWCRAGVRNSSETRVELLSCDRAGLADERRDASQADDQDEESDDQIVHSRRDHPTEEQHERAKDEPQPAERLEPLRQNRRAADDENPARHRDQHKTRDEVL